MFILSVGIYYTTWYHCDLHDSSDTECQDAWEGTGDYNYFHREGSMIVNYIHLVPVWLAAQEIVFFGMLKNTMPFYFYAALALPVFAGTQDERHTATIGLYMGFVVEGIAREGVMVW